MKFYNEKEPLYPETEVSGVILGAGSSAGEGQNVSPKK